MERLYKYTKKLTGYPLITNEILNTVESILLSNGKDVSDINLSKMTWYNLYNLLKTYRYRGGLDNNTSKFSMYTKISKIKILI